MPRLISQIAHLELITPKLEESRRFFVDVMGLQETERTDSSVYLRAPEEIFHHSLMLTEGDQPALGHVGWRADSPEDLDIVVARVQSDPVAHGEWVSDSIGHGRAFRFRGPGGHAHVVFWDVTRAVCPPGEESQYPNRVQRTNPRGVAAQQLDHVTVATVDPWGDSLWYMEKMAFRHVEYAVSEDDPSKVVLSFITTNEKSHDLGLLIDRQNGSGRLHHFSYWVPERGDLHRAADVLIEAGFPLEYGPGEHGIGKQAFLYVREPGGARVEINSGGYRTYAPDWGPVQWRYSQGANDVYLTSPQPAVSRESFPPMPAAQQPATATA